MVAVDAEEEAARVGVVGAGGPGAVRVVADPGFGLVGGVCEEFVSCGVGGGPVCGECFEGVMEPDLEGATGAGEEGAGVVSMGGEGGHVS